MIQQLRNDTGFRPLFPQANMKNVGFTLQQPCVYDHDRLVLYYMSFKDKEDSPIVSC